MRTQIKSLIDELKADGIHDTRVLDAMAAIPRELFVPAPFAARAWENTALPIGKGQTVSQPYVVALMTQALDVDDRCKVLEVGTGSGYQAAILARLCRRLYTVERQKALLRDAEKRFRQLELHTVSTQLGDGGLGWPKAAPFERIIVTAAAHDIPPVLIDQLAPGGIMVVPVGETGHAQTLLKVTRLPGGTDVSELLPVRFVPLVDGVEDY